MRTKKMVIMLVILSVLLALTLCSCSLFGKGNESKGTENNQQQDNTGGNTAKEGWTTKDSSGIYTALIQGCYNVAYKGSQKLVASNKGIMTMESKIRLSLDDNTMWLILKLKYKADSPRTSTMVSLDISSEEKPTATSRIFSAYVYNDNIYLALGADSENDSRNNKVIFSLKNIDWTSYFPFKMEQLDNSDIGVLSGYLDSKVKTNKANKAEYRRSEAGDEWRYSMDIDLDKTFASMFSGLDRLSAKYREIIEQCQNFVAAAYGVEVNDVSAGNLDQSVLKVDFSTVGNAVSAMSVSVEVDSSAKTMLFNGQKMQMSASVEKLSIGNDYTAVDIPFVKNAKEQAKYVDFGGSIFRFDLPLDEYDGANKTPVKSTLKITTKMFQGVGENDYIFAEYKKGNSEQAAKGLYVYKNVLYFYSQKDGDNNLICSLAIDDLGNLANDVLLNRLNGNNTFDPSKLIGYIINGVSIDRSGLKFSVKPNFYTDVWYNFNDMCDYIDSFTSESLFEIDGVDEFREYITTNEIIITMETHIPFFEVVDDTDAYVAGVEAMLDRVGDEGRLPPAGAVAPESQNNDEGDPTAEPENNGPEDASQPASDGTAETDE